MNEPSYVKLRDAAQRLGVPVSVLRAAIAAGELAYVQHGQRRGYLVQLTELERWAAVALAPRRRLVSPPGEAHTYILVDPRDETNNAPDEGRTVWPLARRLRWHLAQARSERASTDVDRWVAGLLAAGVEPLIKNTGVTTAWTTAELGARSAHRRWHRRAGRMPPEGICRYCDAGE